MKQFRADGRAVILEEVKRIDNTDKDAEKFINLQNKVRDGKVDKKTIEELRARVPITKSQKAYFDDAVRIYYTHTEVNRYCYSKLLNQNKPIYKIDALHNNPKGKKLEDDEFMQLKDTLYLTIGSPVFVNQNLWKDAGIFNSAQGVVKSILYEKGQSHPDMPAGIVLKLHECLIPKEYCFKGQENYILVQPETK